MSAGAAVVVIGGGATGLSTAWWLAREKIAVTVVDKGIVGWEASGRNGGGATHPVSPLFREEQRLWPILDGLLGYPTEYRRGRIRIGLSAPELAMYERGARIAEDQGFRVERLQPAALRELVPWVGDRVAGGLFYHFGGHANPQRTMQAYAWAIQDLGGKIFQNRTVTGITVRAGKAIAVETDQGPIGCDKLVIAAGPHTGRIAALCGVSVPLAAARAEMIVTEPVPLIRHGGVDGNGLYGRQTLRGNLAYGGGPHEWIEIPARRTPRAVNSPLMQSLARRLSELFPKLSHVRVIRSWAGVIENTPDGRPILDRLEEPANVVVATMSSVGFGLSPASGHAVAELVTKGSCGFADLTWLGLGRFRDLDPLWREKAGFLPWSPGPAGIALAAAAGGSTEAGAPAYKSRVGAGES